MAFPTTRLDHVHDSIKNILYADPSADLPEVMSASKMLKERRKQEARELYYKTLPRKEKTDIARGVLTNAYHQQLDVPLTDPASNVDGVALSPSDPTVAAYPPSQQQQQPPKRVFTYNRAPFGTGYGVPTPATVADGGGKQVLVTNLVGGKYYGNRGPLLRDIGFGPRGLGQRRDQVSALDGQPVGAATGVGYDDLHVTAKIGSRHAHTLSSPADRANSYRRAASVGNAGGVHATDPYSRVNPITGQAQQQGGGRTTATGVVSGVLRTPESMQTMNMAYGSHTRQHERDQQVIANELGTTVYNNDPDNPKAVAFFANTADRAGAGVDKYDASADCAREDFQKPVPEPAPWAKEADYHRDQSRQQLYPPTAEGIAIVDVSAKVTANQYASERFRQDRQNYVAPSAAVGDVPPFKRQQTALAQPNRYGRTAEGRYDPANSYLGQHTRSASAACQSVGTHSNNYAARRPDPASDLLNCATGKSVHHRAVGVSEDAFRPAFISHEGAHDKTVQRGGWMLSGRDANRNYASATQTKSTLTTRDKLNYDLPTREEMKRTGNNYIREEDPANRNANGDVRKDGLHVRFGEPEMVSNNQDAAAADGEAALYPPPHAQQQLYHDARGYIKGIKPSSSGGAYADDHCGFSAETDLAMHAANPSFGNANPDYWANLRQSYQQPPRHASTSTGTKAVPPVMHFAVSDSLRSSNSNATNRRTSSGQSAATGLGTFIANRATLPYANSTTNGLKSGAVTGGSSAPYSSASMAAAAPMPSSGGGAASLLQPRPLVGTSSDTIGFGGAAAVAASSRSNSSNSRFKNRPVDTMMHLF